MDFATAASPDQQVSNQQALRDSEDPLAQRFLALRDFLRTQLTNTVMGRLSLEKNTLRRLQVCFSGDYEALLDGL